MIPNPFMGAFFAFEGANFCGKSTQFEKAFASLLGRYGKQAASLVPYGVSRGVTVVRTKEPNKDKYWGRRIYKELKTVGGIHTTNPMGFQTWYACDSKENLKNIIIPALRLGSIVVTDRFRPSLVHGARTPADLAELMRMNESIIGEDLIWPDAIFIFDVSIETALARLASKRVVPDMQETREGLEITIPMYRNFAEYFPRANCHIIDANSIDQEAIAAKVMEIMTPILKVKQYTLVGA
jgi:thymidylate kinase